MQGGGGANAPRKAIRPLSSAHRQRKPPLPIMAIQMAEGLLAALWLDRCRQAQRLTAGQGLGYREEVVHTMLTTFLVEQRWGLNANTVDDEGVIYAGGVLNFKRTRPPGDYWLEDLIANKLVMDIERGTWTTPSDYMRGAEFFTGFPPGSLRRLPPGAPSR